MNQRLVIASVSAQTDASIATIVIEGNANVAEERRRIGEQQNLRRAETAEAVLPVDPVEQIR